MKTCESCEGTGLTIDGRWLEVFVQLILIAGEDGKKGRCHPWLHNLALVPSHSPSERMAELSAGLAGREPSVFGHDAIDRMHAGQKIVEAAGLNYKEWSYCGKCKGNGEVE